MNTDRETGRKFAARRPSGCRNVSATGMHWPAKQIRMASTLSPGEEAQLAQTIEMFEVITQSQPQDYQSLEILKEAYSKLDREKDVVNTSKRIAQAYVQMGQLSSAILEYETILQRYPDDPDVQAALQQIESKANNFPLEAMPAETAVAARASFPKIAGRAPPVEIEDGRRSMHKLFVESKIITAGDFELCWTTVDPTVPTGGVVQPFIQMLADKGIFPVDKSLKVLSDKSRFAFLPLQLYDIDMDLARSFPAETCRRWCVLPFDHMSKSVLVATANPFNQQAAKELAEATPHRLLWYLVPPAELVGNVRKLFR
jgi:tetratricopeptide (TPR) repeat protein